MHYLQVLGYYRLSGYFYPFRELIQNQRQNTFIKDTTFNNVLNLYLFDKNLRLLAFDALERIEMAIRTDIAHTLGARNPNAHEMAECLDGRFCQRFYSNGKKYSQKSDHQKWLDKYDSLVNRSKKQEFIAHHLDKYGRLPIWVACEILDFGALSHLYQGMKYTDRETVAKKHNVNSTILADWLKSLNFIRNVVAHHSRLWNVNVVNRSNFTKPFKGKPAEKLDNHRAFGYFYIMVELLNIISPNSIFKERLAHHIHNNFPKITNSAISLKDFGYCADCVTPWLTTSPSENNELSTYHNSSN
ncbi:Abi family protein [Moraxella sp. VT-16-12]|nr:Abi family protein [Moraxella sp. VT-16-12]